MDLSGITMDDPLPSAPADEPVMDESDNSTELDLPPKDDDVVMAQPAADPPAPISNPSIKLLNMETPPTQDKGDETL